MPRSPSLYENNDCESHTSSITIWLENQPDHPEAYFCENQTTTYQIESRTSRNQQRHWPESPTKRRKLGEVSTQSMNARSQRPRRTSPRKDAQNLKSDIPQVQNDESTTEPPQYEPSTPLSSPTRRPIHLDQDTTPRPKSLSLATIIPHPDLSYNTVISTDTAPRSPSTHSYASSSPTRSTASSNTRSSRARSPVKRMNDFQLSNIKIEMKDFGHPDYPVPSAAKALVRDLRRIGSGRGVIPWSVRERAMGWLEDIIFDDSPFYKDEVETDELDVENEGRVWMVGNKDNDRHELIWQRVLEILEAARECRTASLPEAAWNAEVHSRLLRAALEGLWHRKGVWYRDISSAKITDASLLPTVGLSAAGLTMQGKMVDYALVIDPEPALRERISETLRAEGTCAGAGRGESGGANSQGGNGSGSVKGKSINATAAEHVRFEPIAVSFETKRAAIDEDDAHVQLGIWVAAHFARLRQLVAARRRAVEGADDRNTEAGTGVRLPILPLVIIQGHDWKVMVAEAVQNGTVGDKRSTEDSQGYRVVILRDLRLGSTDTVLGIYQLVGAVRMLARWVNEEYRPWLQSETLLGGVEGL